MNVAFHLVVPAVLALAMHTPVQSAPVQSQGDVVVPPVAVAPAPEGAPLVAPRAPKSRAGRALVGRWDTDSRSASGNTPGTLELHADGRMRLAPTGFESAQGVWHVRPQTGELELTVPGIGTASMHYTHSGRTLVLRYADGSTQTFVRAPRAGAPTPRKDPRP
jgi:hypothetical protein